MTKEKLLSRWESLVARLEPRTSKEARLQLRHVVKEIENLNDPARDIEYEKSYLIAKISALQDSKSRDDFPKLKKEAADHCIHVLAALVALYQELPNEKDSSKPF